MIVQLALIALLFAAGWWLRRRELMSAAHVAFVLKFVINIAVPPLIVAALLRAPLDRNLLLPPLAVMLGMSGVLIAAWWFTRRWRLARPRAGAFIISAGCINLAFVYPLIGAIRGTEAITQWVIIDIGATLMTWIVIAYVAASFGGHPGEWRRALGRVLGMAPFWAIIMGLAVRFSGIHVPAEWTGVLQAVGRWLMLLVVPAMGALAVGLRRLNTALLTVLALRVVLGALLAVLLVRWLGIGPQYQALVILAGGAPIGFSAVAISQRESLDAEFAAGATAISILLALIYLPVALLLL